MDYFSHNAARANMPATVQPIKQPRESRSEFAANRQMAETRSAVYTRNGRPRI